MTFFVRHAAFTLGIGGILVSLVGQFPAFSQSMPNTAACRDYLAYASQAGAMSTYSPLMQKYNACVASGGSGNQTVQPTYIPPKYPNITERILHELAQDSVRDHANNDQVWEQASKKIAKVRAEEEARTSKLLGGRPGQSTTDTTAEIDAEIASEISARSPLANFRQSTADESDIGKPRPNPNFSLDEYLRSDSYRNRLGLNQVPDKQDPKAIVAIGNESARPSSSNVVARWLSPTYDSELRAAKRARLQQQLSVIEERAREEQDRAYLANFGRVSSYLGKTKSELKPPTTIEIDWNDVTPSITPSGKTFWGRVGEVLQKTGSHFANPDAIQMPEFK